MCAATRRAAIHVKVTPVRRNLSVGTFAKKSILRIEHFLSVVPHFGQFDHPFPQSQPVSAIPSQPSGRRELFNGHRKFTCNFTFSSANWPRGIKGKISLSTVSATNFIAWSEYYQNWPEAVTKKNYFVFS